jgi:hypothetical protein
MHGLFAPARLFKNDCSVFRLASKANARILVVNDDHLTRDVVCLMLTGL